MELLDLTNDQAASIRPIKATFGEDCIPIQGFETKAVRRPDVVAMFYIPELDITHIHIKSVDGEAEIQISSAQMLELMAQFTTLLSASEPKQ